jgi:hypothetical protein
VSTYLQKSKEFESYCCCIQLKFSCFRRHFLFISQFDVLFNKFLFAKTLNGFKTLNDSPAREGGLAPLVFFLKINSFLHALTFWPNFCNFLGKPLLSSLMNRLTFLKIFLCKPIFTVVFSFKSFMSLLVSNEIKFGHFCIFFFLLNFAEFNSFLYNYFIF